MPLKTHHFTCPSVNFSSPGPCDCNPEAKRERTINSLRALLDHPTLGDVGMASLKGLLSDLIPAL